MVPNSSVMPGYFQLYPVEVKLPIEEKMLKRTQMRKDNANSLKLVLKPYGFRAA
jgi:hypothetical protein